MLGYDPESERHQFNREPHYRLYLGHDGKPRAICVQDFDYYDYDMDRMLSNEAFDSESEANSALRLLKADAATILGLF
ncbi:hypothetical protein AB0C87_24780 [Actinomadura sp. NPDC048021]|uniref:hypothetical protein n=1 Tax=Actinomadura sp. NPDC048021 TaxID=3155385 RepID=UPI0033E05079